MRRNTLRKYRYYIPDGTVVGDGCGEAWSCFEVSNAVGQTVSEFMESVCVHELDADCGVARSVYFEQAPKLVQAQILKMAGIEE